MVTEGPGSCFYKKIRNIKTVLIELTVYMVNIKKLTGNTPILYFQINDS